MVTNLLNEKLLSKFLGKISFNVRLKSYVNLNFFFLTKVQDFLTTVRKRRMNVSVIPKLVLKHFCP